MDWTRNLRQRRKLNLRFWYFRMEEGAGIPPILDKCRCLSGENLAVAIAIAHSRNACFLRNGRWVQGEAKCIPYMR